jgi:hypothetical protein
MRGVCLGRQVAALTGSHSVRRPPDAAKTLIVKSDITESTAMIAKPERRPAAIVYGCVDLPTAGLHVGIRALRCNGRSCLQEI